ncbi:hypothetical protein OFC62_37295, partial [Escherichia coli]|nr:hypothetical protein [Escherichia coli]
MADPTELLEALLLLRLVLILLDERSDPRLSVSSTNENIGSYEVVRGVVAIVASSGTSFTGESKKFAEES